MQPLNLNDVIKFIEENIGEFHERRANSLQILKLIEVLKRKNPYLFKAKNINDAHDLVKLLLDAHLSSQEETVFGDLVTAPGKVEDRTNAAMDMHREALQEQLRESEGAPREE